MTSPTEKVPRKKRSFFIKFVLAHPAIQDPKKRSEARLAAGMALVAIVWNSIGLAAVIGARGFDLPIIISITRVIIAYLIAYILCRTPYYFQGVVFLVLAGSINMLALLMEGVENVASIILTSAPFIFVVATSFLSTRWSTLFVVGNILALGMLPSFSPYINSRDLFRDLLTLSFLGATLIVSVSSRARTEKEELDKAEKTNEKLKNLSNSLAEHVESLSENASELENQSSYLKSAAAVSQAVASLTDTEKLSHQVVDLIRENFGLYYVGLFLVDSENKWAVLQSGTGKAGEIMLASKHKLKIGEGMIGWAIKQKQARVALDVGADAVQFKNPNLPETRSETAIPLRSRGRILGALTVQSKEEAAFSPEIITTLQTMADQIAIAFDNADLLEKSELALESERLAYGEMSYQAWQNLTQAGKIPAYSINEGGKVMAIASETNKKSANEAVNQTLMIEEDGITAVLPIKSHGKILGGIRITKDLEHGTWKKEDIELAETLAEQLSISLESARIFEESQRRAFEERVIGETSAKMREKFDVEGVLETVAREFRNALGIAEAQVWLSADEAKNTDIQ